MVSHYIVDGLGLVVALADAVLGNTRDLGYPPPQSRTRLRAVIQDARQTARDVPEVGRALVAAARLARKQAGRSRSGARSPAPSPVAPVVAPMRSSSCQLSRFTSASTTGMPVRKLLAEPATRWPQVLLPNLGSGWAPTCRRRRRHLATPDQRPHRRRYARERRVVCARQRRPGAGNDRSA
ncbi:hypothetical protein I552_3866 [Mycobacterium xenopi 3993]|nr:hypothetical protein I552_3866 [Mycobacterium xenopi 3993]